MTATRALERLNGWGKVLLVCIPLAVGGLVGYGSLKSDVRHQQEVADRHASRETVDAQYAALLRELQQINARLQRLEDK